jgi:anti-sigma B factor antagonist
MMEITVEEEDKLVLLKISGEVDLHASPRLREELRKIAARGAPPLLLDFREVEYIDSSGLATLIEYLRGGQGTPRKLAICGLQSQVRMVFELVRLHELFPLLPTLEEGRAFLSKDQK